MRDMPNGMLPTAPELDETPTPDETVRMVGLARGSRELELRRLQEDRNYLQECMEELEFSL